MGGELTEDPKERAEHVMLVDLARNDVGRVVEFGTEPVDERMTLEHYSHVMHLTSQVSGRLRGGLGPNDVLAAPLPAAPRSGPPAGRAPGAARVGNVVPGSGGGTRAGAVSSLTVEAGVCGTWAETSSRCVPVPASRMVKPTDEPSPESASTRFRAARSPAPVGIGAALAFVLLLGKGFFVALLAPLAVMATTWFAARWIGEKIGGYTGDTLGAIEQKAEIVFLVMAALFIAH